MDRHKLSRRRVLTGIGGASIGALAGCTSDQEWSDRPPFSAQLAFPTALNKTDHTPIEPDNIYYGPDPPTENSFSDPTLMLMVTDRTVYDDTYVAELPYKFSFQSPAPPEHIGEVITEAHINLPHYLEPITEKDTYKGHMFSEEDLEIDFSELPAPPDGRERDIGSFGALDSRTYEDDQTDPGERDFEVEFDKRTINSFMNLPFDITFTVEFPELDGYGDISRTVTCAVVNHELTGLKELLGQTDLIWEAGREGADSITSVNTSGMYRITKDWTAVQSGQLDRDLVGDATHKDIAAFKDPIDEESFSIEDKEAVVGMTGPIIGRLDEDTVTPSGFDDADSDDPESTEIDAADISMEFEFSHQEDRYPTGVKFIHNSSADDPFYVENVEVEFEGTNVDGTYSLSSVTSDEIAEPGDSYVIDGESPLGDQIGNWPFHDTENPTVTAYDTLNEERRFLSSIELEYSQPEVSGTSIEVNWEFDDRRYDTYPEGIKIKHRSSADSNFQIDAVEVELEGTNADGTYPLSVATSSSVSEPGDTHIVDNQALGTEEAFEAGRDEPMEVTAYYRADGEQIILGEQWMEFSDPSD